MGLYSDRICPALTPEEWERLNISDAWIEDGRVVINGAGNSGIGDPHALAALCLHGRPFGFTRNDVRLLRALAATDSGWVAHKEIGDLADRIGALLSPEEP